MTKKEWHRFPKERCRRCGKIFNHHTLPIHLDFCPFLEKPEFIEPTVEKPKPSLTYRQLLEKKAERFPVYNDYLQSTGDDYYNYGGISKWLVSSRNKPERIKDGE